MVYATNIISSIQNVQHVARQNSKLLSCQIKLNFLNCILDCKVREIQPVSEFLSIYLNNIMYFYFFLICRYPNIKVRINYYKKLFQKHLFLNYMICETWLRFFSFLSLAFLKYFSGIYFLLHI